MHPRPQHQLEVSGNLHGLAALLLLSVGKEAQYSLGTIQSFSGSQEKETFSLLGIGSFVWCIVTLLS